jgi:hypothetical protein
VTDPLQFPCPFRDPVPFYDGGSCASVGASRDELWSHLLGSHNHEDLADWIVGQTY